jgi:hypothetical protein
VLNTTDLVHTSKCMAAGESHDLTVVETHPSEDSPQVLCKHHTTTLHPYNRADNMGTGRDVAQEDIGQESWP